MHSLVVELSNGVYTSIRGLFGPPAMSKLGVLSTDLWIERGYANVVVDRQTATLTVSAAPNGGHTNARLIKEKPKFSVFADFDTQHNIVFSVRYSGCAHSVYRMKHGQIVVLHVYRGDQLKDIEACVTNLTKYANDNGWTHLHTAPTRGVQSGTQGCSGIVAVSERFGGYVRSTLVKMGAGGSILGTTAYADVNAPPFVATQI